MYQGTTLVVPDSGLERLGFKPLTSSVIASHIQQGKRQRGLKPLIPAVIVGTTEVVP
jgi:hypothetical protein